MCWCVFTACDGGGRVPSDTVLPCQPGDRQPCDADTCRGTRICELSGEVGQWGACRCDRDAATSAPPPSPPSPPTLGAHCERDADCPDGAVCYGPDSAAGFVRTAPEPFCVATCERDRDCEPFADAVCVTHSNGAGADTSADGDTAKDAGVAELDAGIVVPDAGVAGLDAGAAGPEGVCLPRCRLATGGCELAQSVACAPLDDAHDARDDAAAQEPGYCRPLCTTDADCEPGSCDRRSGLCRTAAVDPVADTGRDCDPAAPGACAGVCLSLGPDFALCSHRCAFGQPGDCAPESDRTPGGGCLLTTAGGGIGDLGYCGQLCDCNADCAHPEAVCDPFDDPVLENVYARAGVCVGPTQARTAGGIPCR